MSNEKTSQLITGIVILVLGVLIAVFGGQAVLDTYFGIVAIIMAIALLGISIYQMNKKLDIAVLNLILGGILLASGIGLLTDFLSVGLIINFLVLAIFGAGAGLCVYGVYCLCKRDVVKGLLNLIIGIMSIVVSALYIWVDGFRSAFWIVIGVIIAAYGLVQITSIFVKKKSK